MSQLILPMLLFALGLVFVIKGGDSFVDAARWISDVTRVPRFIIGATVVSLATTLPEVLVSVIAVLQGSVGMGVGSAVGSVSANLGLTMGVSLLVMPTARVDRTLCEKAILMLGSTLTLGLLCRDGILTAPEALVLLMLLGVFICTNIWGMRACLGDNRHQPHRPSRGEVLLHLFKFALGTAGILLGARLLVDNGTRLAQILGVPQTVIGITLVAVGTSLPELITTVTALSKREAALSVGNILGANIIDITLILSACAFVSPGGLRVERQTICFDLPMTLTLMGIAALPPLLHRRFFRGQGLGLLVVYAVYLTMVAATAG